MRDLYFGNVPENIFDTYRVLRTGEYNGYLVFNRVLIDVGVPFSEVRPHVFNLDAVLLTHRHSDHFNLKTLARIQELRPDLPIYCGAWLVSRLQEVDIKNINIIKEYQHYSIADIDFMPFGTVHDVPSVGYFLIDNRTKESVFHATDLGELPPMTAHNATVVALEFNHDGITIEDLIQLDFDSARARGKPEYSHYTNSRYNHLSFQKARYFIDNMTRGEDHITVVKLHTSEAFKKYLTVV